MVTVLNTNKVKNTVKTDQETDSRAANQIYKIFLNVAKRLNNNEEKINIFTSKDVSALKKAERELNDVKNKKRQCLIEISRNKHNTDEKNKQLTDKLKTIAKFKEQKKAIDDIEKSIFSSFQAKSFADMDKTLEGIIDSKNEYGEKHATHTFGLRYPDGHKCSQNNDFKSNIIKIDTILNSALQNDINEAFKPALKAFQKKIQAIKENIEKQEKFGEMVAQKIKEECISMNMYEPTNEQKMKIVNKYNNPNYSLGEAYKAFHQSCKTYTRVTKTIKNRIEKEYAKKFQSLFDRDVQYINSIEKQLQDEILQNQQKLKDKLKEKDETINTLNKSILESNSTLTELKQKQADYSNSIKRVFGNDLYNVYTLYNNSLLHELEANDRKNNNIVQKTLGDIVEICKVSHNNLDLNSLLKVKESTFLSLNSEKSNTSNPKKTTTTQQNKQQNNMVRTI